ncbi:MAG: multiheme c-type cytochrome, partial [Gammaproteobacteria bacterium]
MNPYTINKYEKYHIGTGIFYQVLVYLMFAFTAMPGNAASYTGSGVCQDCHATQYKAWKRSHHDLAMQPANE